MPEPLLGRYEAATLLAVDAANGGELAGIEQIFEAFERLFQRRPSASQASESVTLLCEAGFVEYVESELGLTRQARKLLRRAGLPGSPDRPRKVADLLSELEESDLAPEGSVPAPSENDINDALENLKIDDSNGTGPRMGADVAMTEIGGPILGWSAGLTAHRLVDPDELPDVPSVRPRRTDDETGDSDSDYENPAGARDEAPD
jgi:hypothetical protein